MKIKTIVYQLDYSVEFDSAVNAALAEGWQLTRRDVLLMKSQPNDGATVVHNMLYAELAKQDQKAGFDPLAALDGIRKFCDSVTDGDCGADKCPIHEWCESSLKNAVFSPNEWIIPELGE